MEKEKLENMIIDYIDGRLGDEDRATLERELARKEEAFRLYEQMKEVITAMEKSKSLEPTTQLKASFEQMLHDEMARKPAARVVMFQPAVYRIAATVALVLSGVAIGYWVNENNHRESEVLALRKEVEGTKRLMQAMISNDQSASQRIQGVNVALQMNHADDEVVRALVKAMNEDANSNVRLAALDALSKFQAEPEVRKALIQSLATQKDPVIQIALIQLLVRMKEKGVLKSLEKMVEDEQNIKAVKDEAYNGILKLS